MRKINIDDRLLLLNLYATQLIALAAALAVFYIQKRNPLELLYVPSGFLAIAVWGLGLAVIVTALDLLISRFVPEEVTDDGGINRLIFRRRPLWHLVVLVAVVAVCEELLFRGAVQYAWGPYWTSVLFAAIHFRYLRHWLMTGLVFVISYGLGWIYIRTGSLWAPLLAHFTIDLVMGLIIRYRRDRCETDREEYPG